jgi:capsular polysaccharide biosynthesis protein
MEKGNMQNTTEINLKIFLRILAKRKIAFLIAFIIVFVLGLTFTFLVSPEYSSTSKISLKNNELVFSDELYEYLPEVADSLLIIPSYKEDQEIYYIVDKLDIVPEELNSEYVISNTVKALQNKIDAQQLIKSINAILDRWTGILTITTYSKTPDLAFAINKNILEYFIEFKKMQIEKSYNIALEKIDDEIASTGKSLAVLQDSADENNKGLIALEETNREFKKYNNLIVIKENLLGNKDFYIDRIEVIDSPEISTVRNESNYLRNILFSLMAAMSIGIIVVFIVNYFKTPKKSDL